MTPPLITPFYAVAVALLALVLSVRVIRLRRGRGISLGTAGDEELTRAVRAHGNLVEHMPMVVVLMALLELNGGSGWVLHGAGVLLLAGRMTHAWALTARSGSARVAGMAMTFTSLGILIPANVVAAIA